MPASASSSRPRCARVCHATTCRPTCGALLGWRCARAVWESAREEAREHSSVARQMRGLSEVCVCVCARVQARSGAASGGVDAPLTLSCRHAQANVEAANNDGRTALMYSAVSVHDACLRELLAAQVRACVPCDHVPANLRRPAWMAVCAGCVRAKRGSPVAPVCRTSDAGAFGERCVCVCQGAGAVWSGLRWG